MTRTYTLPAGLTIRQRKSSDLPALEALLEKQQARSQYPIRWPLDIPTETFIVRGNELRGWVAILDGEVVGHIAVTGVNHVQGGDKMSAGWEAAHGVENGQLRQIAVFFTDLDRSGSGIGHHLFATATEFALADGYPVLDVVADHPGPVNFYRKRGWVITEKLMAPWDPEQIATVYLMILPREKTGKVEVPAAATVEVPMME